MSALLVVAGEGSGDALAAPVVAKLGVDTFGLGGEQLASVGVDLVADLRKLAAMGFTSPVRKAPALAAALVRVWNAVRSRRPRAALLVGFSEVNARLSALLRARGIRVLWYAPPQVWAWRPDRAARLSALCDRFAVVLPFEEALWRKAGATVEYVGHPAGAGDSPAPVVELTRSNAPRLALLPGSRAQEVRAHLGPMLAAAQRLAETTRAQAVVVRAPALDPATRAWIDERARSADVPVVDDPVRTALVGRHAAIVASGTATLECAALGVPPVIVYRTDAVSYRLAKQLVRVPFIGLPNLVLGRAQFPELLQADVTAERIAGATWQVLAAATEHRKACEEVRTTLKNGLDDRTPEDRVAEHFGPWLA